MSRFHYSRFILIVLLLFINNIAGAVNSEYKNSLDGIELQRTSTGSYNINLYTKKDYSEPVKVIKKNDLNYYILLPETRNSAVPLKINTAEIQNVNTKMYPYAGVDVNNGYTKININTTKPVDFNLNIKSAIKNSVSSAKPQVVADKKPEPVLKEHILKEQTKVQKSDAGSKTADLKQKIAANTKIAENKSKKSTELVQNKNNNIKNSINKSKTNYSKAVANDTSVKKVNKAAKANDRKIAIRSDKELVVKKKTEKVIQEKYIDEEKYTEPVKTPEETEEIKEPEKQENVIDKFEKRQNKNLIANNDLENTDNFAYAAKLPAENNLIEFLQDKFELIQSKLMEYNLGIFDVLLMLITGIIGFFIVLFIASNRQNYSIKRKADIFNENAKSSLVPKKESDSNSKSKGQYFVFDKNVKQTGLLKPATSDIKKNYELSTYDPDIRIDYKNNSAKNSEEGSSEYDIIQKILKEDVYVDIEPGQAETITKEKIESRVKEEEVEESIQKSNIVTSPIAQEKEIQQKTEEIKSEIQVQPELKVLSSVEIAPERGFMCVSYENNVSLIGYIFDDIFVLHNFKKPELESYEIQSRLSERDISSSLYIVKVAEDKMIIRVSNKSMKLEITL